MDRIRNGSPAHSRQWSGGSGSTESLSPTRSPAHPQSRLSPAAGMSSIKRTQNFAAKAAAQRLAQVMASQTTDDDEEEDDLGLRFGAPSFSSSSLKPSNGSSNGSSGVGFSLPKPNRAPSPALGRNFMDHAPSVRSTSTGRPASVRSTQVVKPSRTSLRTPVAVPPIDPPSNRLRDNR